MLKSVESWPSGRHDLLDLYGKLSREIGELPHRGRSLFERSPGASCREVLRQLRWIADGIEHLRDRLLNLDLHGEFQAPDRQERIFKALADRRRRRILDLLKSQALATGELCHRFPELDRCTVMQHLGVLERAGLVIVKREGRLRWNYINPLPIKEIYDRWIGPVRFRRRRSSGEDQARAGENVMTNAPLYCDLRGNRRLRPPASC